MFPEMNFSHPTVTPCPMSTNETTALIAATAAFLQDHPFLVPPPAFFQELLQKAFSSGERPCQPDCPINLCIRDQQQQQHCFDTEMHHDIAPHDIPAHDHPECEATSKRRRFGWKGICVCASCCSKFNTMGELNQHFTLSHADLLKREWAAAVEKRQRRSCRPAFKIPHWERHHHPHHDNSTSSTESVNSDQSGSKACKPAKKTHLCPFCNYCAKWPTELQKHVAVHASLRPYACMICGNCYKWSWDLGRHFSAVHASLPNPYKMHKGAKLQMEKLD